MAVHRKLPLGSRQGTDVLEDRRKIASKSRGKICLGLWGAVAGGVGQCRLSRVPLQVRLAHPQSHGDPRGALLPYALCLAARRADPAHAPGVIGVVSPSDSTAAGTQGLLHAAISTVRVGAYRIRAAKVHTGVTEVMARFGPASNSAARASATC